MKPQSTPKKPKEPPQKTQLIFWWTPKEQKTASQLTSTINFR